MSPNGFGDAKEGSHGRFHFWESLEEFTESFILRNLLVRGLIVKKDNPNDARTFLYTASHDLFSYLGVSSHANAYKFSTDLKNYFYFMINDN
jgi:hypothetical protein